MDPNELFIPATEHSRAASVQQAAEPPGPVGRTDRARRWMAGLSDSDQRSMLRGALPPGALLAPCGQGTQVEGAAETACEDDCHWQQLQGAFDEIDIQLDLLDLLSREAQIAANLWMTSYNEAGSAYALAVDRFEETSTAHRRFLERQATLAWTIFRVVCPGLFSYVDNLIGLSSTLRSARDDLYARLELLEGQTRLLGAVGSSVRKLRGEVNRVVERGATHVDLVSPDEALPQVFQNHLVNRVLRSHSEVLGEVVGVQRVLILAKRLIRMTMDSESPHIAAASEGWVVAARLLTSAVTGAAREARRCPLFRAPPTLSDEALAIELERGLWARWIPHNMDSEITVFVPPGMATPSDGTRPSGSAPGVDVPRAGARTGGGFAAVSSPGSGAMSEPLRNAFVRCRIPIPQRPDDMSALAWALTYAPTQLIEVL